MPLWVRGFTRKARIPRGHRKPKSKELTLNSNSLVPELGCGESSNEENEEQLLYRVPVFDSIKLCTSTNEVVPSQEKDMLQEFGHGESSLGFLPSEMELEEFVADVESLSGKGLDKESFDMEALGILECRESDREEVCLGGGRVKVEDDDEEDKEDYITNHVDAEREPFELNFDYDSPATCQEEGESQLGARERIAEEDREGEGGDVKFKKKVLLRLDYKGVITAWADQRSPWTGDRPQVDPSECWPHCMVCFFSVSHIFSGQLS